LGSILSLFPLFFYYLFLFLFLFLFVFSIFLLLFLLLLSLASLVLKEGRKKEGEVANWR